MPVDMFCVGWLPVSSCEVTVFRILPKVRLLLASSPSSSSASSGLLWTPAGPDITASASSSGAISLQKLMASSTAICRRTGPRPIASSTAIWSL